MAGEVRGGEERVDARDHDSGPHGCVSSLIIFILDTLVKTFFILFFNTIFSVLFRMFLT